MGRRWRCSFRHHRGTSSREVRCVAEPWVRYASTQCRCGIRGSVRKGSGVDLAGPLHVRSHGHAASRPAAKRCGLPRQPRQQRAPRFPRTASFGRVRQRVPRAEQFGLTSQLRRAAVSIGSNIVEGCHREGNRAFLPFLHHALGSAAEMQFQLRIVLRLGLGQREEVEQLQKETESVKKQIARLIVYLKQ